MLGSKSAKIAPKKDAQMCRTKDFLYNNLNEHDTDNPHHDKMVLMWTQIQGGNTKDNDDDDEVEEKEEKEEDNNNDDVDDWSGCGGLAEET